MTTSCITPLVTRIRESVHKGLLRSGEMVGSEYELARQEGISRDSVRRAVQMLINEGLIERRPGKGLYVRDPKVSTRKVQVIVPNLTLEQNARLAWGVQQAGIQRGVMIQVYDARASMDQDVEVLHRLPEDHLDGAVILTIAHPRFAAALYELEAKQFPFVLVDEPLQDLRVSCVTSDNYGGGYTAGKELIRLGHQRIGFIGNLSAQTVRLRLDGLRDAISDAGLVFDRSLIGDLNVLDPLGDWSECNRKVTLDLMNRKDRATAILCSCDQVAATTYLTVKECGLRIPQDISIIGFDNISLCNVLDPPLSSIVQPHEQMGEVALSMLLDQITGGRSAADDEQKKTRVLPTSLVSRQSVGTCTR